MTACALTKEHDMGNFKIEIEAVGGHGSDRTAKPGEPLNIMDGPDKLAQDFAVQLASSGCSIVSATLTHWPDSTPIVDDLKNGVRVARAFGEDWQGEPILQFFAFAHLPEKMQAVSKPFCHAAYVLVATLPRNPERTVALRKLLEAKDAAVRAFIAK
jgi:hypothetical protein